MKIITMSAFILALSSGAAMADHWHGGGGGGGRSVVVREHRGGWGGGGAAVHVAPRVTYDRGYHYNGGYNGYRGGYRYNTGWNGGWGYRRPVYVQRPFIRERYFDFRLRPRIIVENYAPMAGYYWVAGEWQWNGAEWIWQPGHYEPDQAYVDPSYSAGAYYE